MFEMKTKYLTGIKQIDDEHAKIFEIAEQAYQLLKADFVSDKYDHIIAILAQLREYAQYHFAHEEEYMMSINYKKMFTQKMEHQAFLNDLDKFDLNHIDENQTESIEEILNFLDNWLVHHILECDSLIGK